MTNFYGHFAIENMVKGDESEKKKTNQMLLLFAAQPRFSMTLGKRLFEIISGKGENADYQYFLLFQQSFLPYQRKIVQFEPH